MSNNDDERTAAYRRLDATTSDRAEVESALRRDLRHRLDVIADKLSVKHLERDLLSSYLQALGLDELLVVDALLAMAVRRLPYYDQVWRLIARLTPRLVMGRDKYGPLRMDTDRRRWSDEMRDELLDALVYASLSKLKGEREYPALTLTMLMGIGGER